MWRVKYLGMLLPGVVLLIATVLTACSTSLVNVRDSDNFSSPKGVPWVESREYDVYVYVRPVGRKEALASGQTAR